MRLVVTELNRDATVAFLLKGLHNLSEGYSCLDASRPWLVYWIVHSLELLGEFVDDEKQKRAIISFLAK
jgi:protein farnesyltransferase subunit beta